MTALTPSDIADHLNGSLAKPWNQQQADKMLIQRTAALQHLDRLKKLRGTA